MFVLDKKLRLYDSNSYKRLEFIAPFNISEYKFPDSRHATRGILPYSEVPNIHYFVTKHKNAKIRLKIHSSVWSERLKSH
jgi:hypothetical protein